MTADQLACGVGHRHDAAARNCRGLERVVDRETEHDRQPIRQDAFERPEVLGDGLIGPLLLNVSPGANWHDHSVAFHLRPAVPDDAESIERVRVAGWRAAYRGIVADAFLDTMTGDVEQRRRYLTENMQGVQGVIEMVAVDDGNLVGWVVAGQSRTTTRRCQHPRRSTAATSPPATGVLGSAENCWSVRSRSWVTVDIGRSPFGYWRTTNRLDASTSRWVSSPMEQGRIWISVALYPKCVIDACWDLSSIHRFSSGAPAGTGNE